MFVLSAYSAFSLPRNFFSIGVRSGVGYGILLSEKGSARGCSQNAFAAALQKKVSAHG